MRILNAISNVVIIVGIGLIVYAILGLKYDPSDAATASYIYKLPIGSFVCVVGFILKGNALGNLKAQQEAERHKELIDAINKNNRRD